MTTMSSDRWLRWRYSKPRMCASKAHALNRLATPQSIGGPGGIRNHYPVFMRYEHLPLVLLDHISVYLSRFRPGPYLSQPVRFHLGCARVQPLQDTTSVQSVPQLVR